MGDDDLLRVHSADLHDHVAQEVGECLESGLYTDLVRFFPYLFAFYYLSLVIKISNKKFQISML